jgi:branched-chain amino acid transport system permease protein
MNETLKNTMLFGIIAVLILYVGFAQSWNSALLIVAMGLISSIMALGVNLQWGFAGLFNVGIMGFVALGGLAAVVIGMPATEGAMSAGGWKVFGALLLGAGTVFAAVILSKTLAKGWMRNLAVLAILVVGFFVFRGLLDPAVELIEEINPAATGYLGGLGLPVLLAWPVGGLFAAAAAWVIGKTALGLRSDYLAIATLGIPETRRRADPRGEKRDRRAAPRAL